MGVGSNIDPEQHVLAAAELLGDRVELIGVSTFYRTAPVARPEQPPFINGVFVFITELGPAQVKQLLGAVEAKLGRRRTEDRHAPRTIDLDLLILGELVFNDGRLRLPDPDIRRRPFVGLPLLELAPDLILPDTGEPLRRVAAALSGAGLEPDVALTAALRNKISGSAESL